MQPNWDDCFQSHVSLTPTMQFTRWKDSIFSDWISNGSWSQHILKKRIKFTHNIFSFFPYSYSQAQAALMYDAVFVLVEAFNKLLKKKPDQFRSYTMRRSSSQHTYTNSSYGNLIANGQTMRVLDCNIAKGWINPVIY